MNIAIAVNQFPSVSETFILDQITGLIDKGHNVSIAARVRGNSVQTHDVVSSYDLLNRTIYCDVPFGEDRLVQLADILSILMKHGFRSPIPYGRLFSDSLFYPVELGEEIFLSQPFVASEYDVVHSHFGIISAKIASMKKHGFVNSPLVASFHGSGIRAGQSSGGDIYSELFEQADLLLANSQHTLTKLREFGAPESITEIHPVGVNLDNFPFAEKSEPGNIDETVVLSVGRLVQEKGHEIGIRSFAETLKSNSDLELHYRIVGAGPLRPDLESLIADLGIAESVQLVGPVSQDSVLSEMANADIFLHPSLSEGFGKVLLEAQAVGLPIVASDVGGISDAVNEGDSALLFDEPSPDSISAALEKMLSNPSSWEEMRHRGREYVEENYSVRVLNRDLIQKYEAL